MLNKDKFIVGMKECIRLQLIHVISEIKDAPFSKLELAEFLNVDNHTLKEIHDECYTFLSAIDVKQAQQWAVENSYILSEEIQSPRRSDISYSTDSAKDFWLASVICFLVFLLFLLLMRSAYPALYTSGNIMIFTLIFFIISLLISSIKSLGFTYYAHLYGKKESGKIKLPGLAQRILFHIFREGSVIEECLDNIKSRYETIENDILRRADLTKRQRKFYRKVLRKKDRPYYNWIQTSTNPTEDLVRFRSKTDITALTYNEVFHCLDITFLFITMLCFLSMLVNTLLMLFSYEFSLVVPFIIGVASLICHFTTKSLAKASAALYLREIDSVFYQTHKNILPTSGNFVILEA
jgi:hypothetical protein